MGSKHDPTKFQFVWSREAILKLLALWEENECLYNPKHELYHNKRARHNVIKEMADNLKDFSPDIGPSEVKNKITYLRGQYTREISRAREKNRAGKEVYVPSVFWFTEMGFLEEFINRRKSSPNLSQERTIKQIDDSCDSSELLECNVSPIQACKRARVSSDTPVSSSMSQENAVPSARNTVSLSFPANLKKKVDSKDEAFCNYIQMELSEITNTNIKDELIEKITLAVFEAKKEQKFYTKDIDNSFADF